MSQPNGHADPQNALLGDLESIRTLLEDDDNAQPPVAAATEEREVPVLDDIVDAAMADAQAPATRSFGLDDDLFRALLSDEWRQSADAVLRQARTLIDAHPGHWSTAETDALNDTLKVRIDTTIKGWMRGMLVTHMAELHDAMLAALSEELKTTIDTIIEQRSEASDGQ